MQKTVETNQDVVDLVEKNKWKRLGVTLAKDWRLYVLLIPMLVFLICFKYIPVAGILTGFKWGDDGTTSNYLWNGLYWFNRIFFGAESSIFWRSFRNTFVNSMYGLIVGFPIPIILALLFSEIKVLWYRSIVQVCAYLPHFVSVTVVTTIIKLWCEGVEGGAAGGWLYHMVEAMGMLEYTTSSGATSTYVDSILFHGKFFRPIYQISGVWEGAGYGSIVYFAAILAISPTSYEAARIDGATKMQQIRYVTFPGMAPTLTIMLIMRIGHILNIGYEKVLLLVGEKQSAWETADVVSTLVYRMSGRAGDMYTGAVYSQIGIVADLFNSIIAMFLVLGANAISRRVSSTSLF
ncbi:MAG: sugar ABC transporter permease [Acholeplasmatales bacterium]|nr:sugar ABC transporter permease [Acholeplasmatales bacterium]